MRRTREVCACEAYPPGHETGMVVCWKCAQAVVRVVDDGIGPELVRSWCAHAAGYCICSRWDARPRPVHYPSAALNSVLVPRDDLRTLIEDHSDDTTTCGQDYQDSLARLRAALDAPVPVQQDEPECDHVWRSSFGDTFCERCNQDFDSDDWNGNAADALAERDRLAARLVEVEAERDKALRLNTELMEKVILFGETGQRVCVERDVAVCDRNEAIELLRGVYADWKLTDVGEFLARFPEGDEG